MNKKLLAFILTLVLVFALGATSVFADKTVLSSQKLSVNGENISCQAYNIDGSNYFKLRDLAYLLKNTGSRFSVGYDDVAKVVSIGKGGNYATVGGELAVGNDLSGTSVRSSQKIMIDGAVNSRLSVYNIGGNNYFKLRDMGDALGFDVDYYEATQTMIVTSKGATKKIPDVTVVEVSPFSVIKQEGDFSFSGLFTDIITTEDKNDGWYYYYSKGTEPGTQEFEWRPASGMYTSFEIIYDIRCLQNQTSSFSDRFAGMIVFNAPVGFCPSKAINDAYIKEVGNKSGTEASKAYLLQENPGQADRTGSQAQSLDAVPLTNGQIVRHLIIADMSRTFYNSWEKKAAAAESMWAYFTFDNKTIYALDLKKYLKVYES